MLRWRSTSHLSEAAFPACRLQPGACLVSPQKEKPRSEAPRELEKQAEHRQAHRTPSPPVLGSPPPGFSCSRGVFFSGPFCRTKQKRKVLSRLFLCGRRHRVSQETGPGTCTRLGKTADPPGDDHAGLGSCPACSLSPSPVSAGRRSHPFLQGRLPPYRRWTSALPHLLHPTPPTPSAVHHRERLARRPGQGPLWSFPTSAAPAGFQSHSRKAPAASTGGHTCPGSSELPSAPGERQL